MLSFMLEGSNPRVAAQGLGNTLATNVARSQQVAEREGFEPSMGF